VTNYDPKKMQCCRGSVGLADLTCCGGSFLSDNEVIKLIKKISQFFRKKCCHQSVLPTFSWRQYGMAYNPSRGKRCCRSSDSAKKYIKAVAQDVDEEICCAGQIGPKKDKICKRDSTGQEYMTRRYPDYFVDFIFEDPADHILDQFRGTNF
jgi:hypothetical protein